MNQTTLNSLMGIATVIFIVVECYKIYQLRRSKKISGKTEITLAKKRKGDSLFFSKTFDGFIPNISSVSFLKRKFKVQDYYFEPISKTVKINAVDSSSDVSDEELMTFDDDGWKCENLMFIPIKEREY